MNNNIIEENSADRIDSLKFEDLNTKDQLSKLESVYGELSKKFLEEYITVHKVNAKQNNSRIAFVFSCPGRIEMESDQLLHGITGENLDLLLIKLHKAYPEVFSKKERIIF